MSIELTSDKAICCMCGEEYPRRRGYFPISYAALHKGLGYVPICKTCIDQLFDTYLAQCNDTKLAARQMCRKLDLFWSEKLYESVLAKSTNKSLMTQYMSRLLRGSYPGKSYDDTLSMEGTLWSFDEDMMRQSSGGYNENVDFDESYDDEDAEEVDEDVIMFWGTGYSPSMYKELEQRRKYWMSKFPDGIELDIGTEAIIRQICSLELDINRDRAAGKAVDKNINALNTLLGSANLKPGQKRQEEADAIGDSPLGVWLYRFERERPLPDEYEDSKILRYVFTWMGHLCKMLGVKGNKYTKLYEDEIQKYSVEKPEYDGDDEEAFLEMLESSPE